MLVMTNKPSVSWKALFWGQNEATHVKLLLLKYYFTHFLKRPALDGDDVLIEVVKLAF